MAIKQARRIGDASAKRLATRVGYNAVEPTWKSTVAPVVPGTVQIVKSKFPWPVVAKKDQSPDREYSIVGRDLSTITLAEGKGQFCPACNSESYHQVEGCKHCQSCGYSPCA